jgi:hypothetical protein
MNKNLLEEFCLSQFKMDWSIFKAIFITLSYQMDFL